MTCRFLYILLTIMMFQLSWGVVAEYCEHESGRAAQHLGHHASLEDPAQEALSSLDQPVKSKAGTLHSHCTSCTHSPATFETLLLTVAVLEPLRAAPSSPLLRFSSIDVAPPERPQWVAAV